MAETLKKTEPFDAVGYARQAAQAVGLSLDDEDLAGVASNLERTAAFAQLLAEVPGVDDVEPAPVFAPRERGS